MDSWVVLLVAVTNLLTVGIVAWMKFELGDVMKNVLKIEKQTNSMQDALVASTARTHNLQGRADERAEGDARAVELLRANKEERK